VIENPNNSAIILPLNYITVILIHLKIKWLYYFQSIDTQMLPKILR
jgi:hypothetical protein